MNPPTLESLVARIAVLERQVADLMPGRSWRNYRPPDRTPEELAFVLEVEAGIAAAREAARTACDEWTEPTEPIPVPIVVVREI